MIQLYRLWAWIQNSSSQKVQLWDKRYPLPTIETFSAYRPQKRVVFFCSSAGEYEQALPIISRLQKNSFFCHVIFFSPSGMNFHLSRKDKTSASMSVADTLWHWNKFFETFKPHYTLIIRHELWPAFLYCAKRSGSRTILINTQCPVSCEKKRVRSFLLKYFIDSYALAELPPSLKPLDPKAIYTGSTKIDRVLDKVHELKQYQSKKCNTSKSRLLLGSAWPQDVEVVLDGLSYLKQEHHFQGQVIIVPHNFEAVNHALVQEYTNKRGLSLQFINALHQDDKKYDHTLEKPKDVDVVLIFSLGKLFTSYSYSDLAFIGGAMHYRVHNPLEAIAWGVPIAFGPNIENCEEAVQARQQGLAEVCRNGEEVSHWWKRHLKIKIGFQQKSAEYLKQRSGAAQKIIDKNMGLNYSTRADLNHF
ncbi:MAG: hypothetical protein OXT67_11375 [Zetaproteobacteria bacterium]|nr:hypothetical protein [Zetaproteobacteria bacterium]